MLGRNLRIVGDFTQTIRLLPSAVFKSSHRFIREERTIAAAAIAYYALFSLFPLVLVTLAVLAYIRPELASYGPILNLARTYIPGAEDLVQTNLNHLVRARSSIGIIGLLSLLWSASSVFAALGRALDRMLGPTRTRSPVQFRLIGLLMVFVIATVAITALAGTAVLMLLTGEDGGLPLPRLESTRLLSRETLPALMGGITLVTVFSAVLLTYRYLPQSSPPVRDLWPGALLATIGLAIARNIFSYYVSGFGRYQLIYGTLGTAIVVLLWFFISAAIFLWGAEVGGVLHELRLNGRRHDSRS